MTEKPGSDTLLRDMLAIDRTKMANERTLLAYVRTALAVAVVGATLIQFFDNVTATIAGVGFIVAAVVMLVIGVRRFRSVQRDLDRRDMGV